MADEIIGSVGVEVRADYSDLAGDFDKAVSMAVAAGHTLAEAIQMSMATPDSAPVSEAFNAVGVAAENAAQQLQLFSTAENDIPFAEASGQLNLFSTQLESTGAEQAAKEMQDLAQNVQHAGETAEHSHGQFGELVEELLKLGGIVFSLESIKEFGEHILEVAADEEKFTVSMKALTGSAQSAAEALHHVEDFSFANALPIEQVEKVTQKMTALGFSVEQTERAMQAAANAARATGNDFESTAAAIERMALSGMAGSRQLVALGIGSKDLAAALGVTEAAAKGAFKALDQNERVEALTRALSKFAGVSQAAAETMSGAWTNAQNQFRLVLADIGKELAPAATAILHFAQEVAIPQIANVVHEFTGLLNATIGFAHAFVAALEGPIEALHHFTTAFTETVNKIPGLATALDVLKTVYGALSNPISVATKELQYFAQVLEMISGKIPGAKVMHDALAASIKNLNTASTAAGLGLKSSGDAVSETVEKIVSRQHELANAVTTARGAYEMLSNAFRTGTPLANGYKVSQEDVTRALANLNAALAAASLATTQHEQKTMSHIRAMKLMPVEIAVIVDALKLQENRYKESEQAAARYNVAMAGMTTGTFKFLTPAQLADKHLQEFNQDIEKLVITAPQLQLDKPFIDAEPVIKKVFEAIDQGAMATDGAADAFERLEDGLKRLGIRGQQYYEQQVNDAQDAYDQILRSGEYTDNELAQAAAVLALKQARYALQTKEITVEAYRDIVAAVQKDLDDLDGDTANSVNHRLSDEQRFGKEVQQINHNTFDQLERGLAHSIVELRGFGDLWKQLWHKLAEDLLTIMFKVLLNPLEDKISKVLGSIFGGGGGGGGAAGAASSAGGLASGAGGAAASGVTGILGTVFSGISAATGVFSIFQNMHQETTLNAIEGSTRYTKILTEQNLPTIAIHEVLHTGQLDAIGGTLWKIYDAIHDLGNSGMALRQKGAEAASVVVNMHQPRIGRLTDPSEVSDIMQEGVNQARAAGAFRFGVFPA